MDTKRQQTIITYNNSAKELAEYFKGIGSREDDIELALRLANSPTGARVIEVGCGDGRDAVEIVKRVGWYVGFDISEGLIELAREKVPTGMFQVADVNDYDFPSNIDVVFAFASVLHISSEELGRVFDKLYKCLKPKGIFFVSVKYAPAYAEKMISDRFGSRQFYFYNEEVLTNLAGSKFEIASSERYKIGNGDWLKMSFRKA